MNSSAVDNGHGRNCGMSGYMAYNGAHLRRPHSGAISDEELVRRSLLGEDEAFAQLYERYKQPITATMTRIMRDRTEAQDATQEVFLKMYRALPAWDSSRAKFSTWVYRLAANHAIDCWRLRRRRAEVFLMEPEKMADAPSHAGVFRGMGDHSLEKRVEQNEKLAAETRRDPTIVPRVVPVAEAMTAMVLVDFLMMWNGYRSLCHDMEGPQLGASILTAPDDGP